MKFSTFFLFCGSFLPIRNPDPHSQHGSGTSKLITTLVIYFFFCLSGFLSKFVESHRVMLQGNSNLKPKESQSAFAATFWEFFYEQLPYLPFLRNEKLLKTGNHR
jgi:hypothetical protein